MAKGRLRFTQSANANAGFRATFMNLPHKPHVLYVRRTK
jgi:hypothetical protein